MNADLGLLLQQAYLGEELSESDLSAAEDGESPNPPAALPLPLPVAPPSLKQNAPALDGDEDPGTAPRVQSRQNRNRTKRRRQAIAMAGHPRRGGNGFLKNVLPSAAVESQLTMADLPVASGAFVGIDTEFRGSKTP